MQEFISLSKNSEKGIQISCSSNLRGISRCEIRIIEDEAMSVELLGVKIVKAYALQNYYQLTDVEIW